MSEINIVTQENTVTATVVENRVVWPLSGLSWTARRFPRGSVTIYGHIHGRLLIHFKQLLELDGWKRIESSDSECRPNNSLRSIRNTGERWRMLLNIGRDNGQGRLNSLNDVLMETERLWNSIRRLLRAYKDISACRDRKKFSVLTPLQKSDTRNQHRCWTIPIDLCS